MPYSTNMSNKTAGCIIRVEAVFILILNMEVVSFCMASRLRKEAYIIAESFPFHSRSTGQRLHYILTYTFDFCQVLAYIMPTSCEFQISAL
jgi:hypothetical protein